MTVHLSSRPRTRGIGYSGADEVVWDDLRIPGTSVRLGASAPDLVAFLGAGGLLLPAFDGGATLEQVYFTIQMPHGYKLGTDITPHVHWTPTTAGAGNVKWNLEYSWSDTGATFPAATTIAVTDAAGGTAWEHTKSFFPAIDGSGITKVSSMLVCRLFRDPSDGADTYGADASFSEFDFHYQIDTIGSQQPSSK
jgi:hypothetical protein